MAGRPEVGEDAGLEALAKSVEQELAKTAGKKTVSFTVTPPRGQEPFECVAIEGQSLKDVAEHGSEEGADILGEHIECACSGVMACSTCHVYIHPDWVERVGEPCEAELDMIELAHEPRDNSRLGCQLRLTAKLDGLHLSIPDSSNNLF